MGHICAAPKHDAEPEFIIFVHGDYQNRGVGTELIKQLIAYADDRDHDSLTLRVGTRNERALTVCDNIGFEVVEQLRGELSMRLSLDAPVVTRVQAPPAERER